MISSLQRCLATVITCALAMVACAQERETQVAAEPVVADSAGIRIVVNPRVSFDGPAPEWRVSPRPSVVIGRSDGRREYLFDRIAGVQRLSDGRWVVADMGSSQVRYYDTRGNHLRSFGRRGEGPEEFRQIMGLYRLSGDTVGVDDSMTRMTLLDPDGGFIGAVTYAAHLGAERVYPVAAFGDGTIIGMRTPATVNRVSEATHMFLQYQRLSLSLDGERRLRIVEGDTVARWTAFHIVPTPTGSAQRVQFQDITRGLVLSDGIAVVDPGAFEIRVFDGAGRLESIIRAEWQARAVTDADVQRARSDFVGSAEGSNPVPARLRQQREQMADAWVTASHMPAFSEALSDELDHIWLREYVPHAPGISSMLGTLPAAATSETRWLVFDRSGAIVGRATMPARFAPLIIGSDFVAGVYRDDMDVEYVRSYPLQRGSR